MSKVFISLIFLLLASVPAHAAESCDTWAHWEDFAKFHIQADGRVIDYTEEAATTSEGQAYAMFFSLLAKDKNRFDRILKWTSNNLSKGELHKNLPAWKWGKSADGTWKVLDDNAASDADIWIAYSLFQASVLWNEKAYFDTALAVLKNISAQEVVSLPGSGSMVIPAPYGYALDPATWRLNPSYVPIQLMRYFATVDPSGPWEEIIKNTYKMISAGSKKGMVPDWILHSASKGFYFDAQKGKYTSYEAIRVYLWWAMLNKNDPYFALLKKRISGSEHFSPSNLYLPERVDIVSGDEEGSAPLGFGAVIAAYRYVVYAHKDSMRPQLLQSSGYYNHVLSMFSYAWMDNRFEFNLDGSLLVGTKSCSQQ